MAITEATQRNHDQLFPGIVSPLTQTDPELVEYLGNFALDEVLAHGDLDTRTRLMVQLAALIACQAGSAYRAMLHAALTNGVTPIEAKEIVYQAIAYVGIGKVYDFLEITNDVLTERGVALPLPGQSTTTQEARLDPGLSVQKQIFGADPIDRCTHRLPPTSSTSSAGSRQTASATTTPAAASTCPPASCSPTPCSWPTAAATLKSVPTSQPT